MPRLSQFDTNPHQPKYVFAPKTQIGFEVTSLGFMSFGVNVVLPNSIEILCRPGSTSIDYSPDVLVSQQHCTITFDDQSVQLVVISNFQASLSPVMYHACHPR
jgi:hypothetical protein